MINQMKPILRYSCYGLRWPLIIAVGIPLLIWVSPFSSPNVRLLLIALPALLLGPLLGGKDTLDDTRLFHAVLPINRTHILFIRGCVGAVVLMMLILLMFLLRPKFFMAYPHSLLFDLAQSTGLFCTGFTLAALARRPVMVLLSWPMALVVCGLVLIVTSQVDFHLGRQFGLITTPVFFLVSVITVLVLRRLYPRRNVFSN